MGEPPPSPPLGGEHRFAVGGVWFCRTGQTGQTRSDKSDESDKSDGSDKSDKVGRGSKRLLRSEEGH